MTLRLRTAAATDVPVIAALRRAWVEEDLMSPVVDPGFDEAMAAWFEREQHQRVTWLAEDEGVVVGMLNLLVFTRMPRPATADPHADRWGYVANVYVVAEARQHGVGARLVDAVTAHADSHAFARLVLSPSARSVPLYARAGFVPATSLMVRPGR